MPQIIRTERVNEYQGPNDVVSLVSWVNQIVRILRNNFSALEALIDYKDNYYTATTVTTTPYQIDKLISLYIVDSSAGAMVVNLPSATRYKNKFVYFKRKSTSNTVTITPAGTETIDNASSYVLPSASLDSATLFSDGFNWWII